MPRAAEAIGVREKLVGYSLDVAHEHGGPKARGFERILGITIADVDYLEAAIRDGIVVTPVSSMRSAALRGVNCVVEVPVRGLGEKSGRTVDVRTAWEIADAMSAPRLITAYPRP